MKIPSLFFGGPGEVVRSSKEEYLTKDGVFTPKTFEDFYFFINQGYKLAEDPKKESYYQHKYATITDEEVIMNAVAAREKTKESIESQKERIRRDSYEEYFKDIQAKINSGELDKYPVDSNAEAEMYAENKVMEFMATIEPKIKESDAVARGEKKIEELENEIEEEVVKIIKQRGEKGVEETEEVEEEIEEEIEEEVEEELEKEVVVESEIDIFDENDKERKEKNK